MNDNDLIRRGDALAVIDIPDMPDFIPPHPRDVWCQGALDGLGAYRKAIDALPAVSAPVAELVEALRTVRDYVDDALRGTLRYRGEVDISELAKQDAARIDAVLAKWEAK